MKYRSFTEMSVWKKSHSLSLEVFNLSIGLPRSEDYGLTSQLRRSSNSVSGNIAEGFGRRTKKDKANFYIVARGSSYETQSHLMYASKVGYIKEDDISQLINEYDELNFELNKIINSLLSQPQP